MLKEHLGSRLREGADLSPLLSRCVFLVELDAQHEGVEAEEYDEGHLKCIIQLQISLLLSLITSAAQACLHHSHNLVRLLKLVSVPLVML